MDPAGTNCSITGMGHHSFYWCNAQRWLLFGARTSGTSARILTFLSGSQKAKASVLTGNFADGPPYNRTGTGQKERHGKTPAVGTTLGSSTHAYRTGAGARGAWKRPAFSNSEPATFPRLYQTAHSELMGISGITREVRKAEARAVSNPAQLFAATQFKLNSGGAGSSRE